MFFKNFFTREVTDLLSNAATIGLHLVSATFIGLLLGGSMALSTLVSFYGGWLSDKWGRRNILLFGCVWLILLAKVQGCTSRKWRAVILIGENQMAIQHLSLSVRILKQ